MEGQGFSQHSYENPSRNSGFAFIKYYNNAYDDYTTQKIVKFWFKLDGNFPTVTWATPKSAPYHSTASQVSFKRNYQVLNADFNDFLRHIIFDKSGITNDDLGLFFAWHSFFVLLTLLPLRCIWLIC